MMSKNNLFLFGALLFLYQIVMAQQAILYGTIKSNTNQLIDGLSVEYKKIGAISDKQGNYLITLPANKDLSVSFSHLAYENQIHIIKLKEGEKRNFDLVFEPQIRVISEVELIDDALREQNITSIDKKNLEVITGPTGGVEGLISTLAGVSTKNEMSSQYSVRGGNYDENLVYGLYNGYYTFSDISDSHPMAILNNNIPGIK